MQLHYNKEQKRKEKNAASWYFAIYLFRGQQRKFLFSSAVAVSSIPKTLIINIYTEEHLQQSKAIITALH